MKNKTYAEPQAKAATLTQDVRDVRGPALRESRRYLPRGYRLGAHVSQPGRSYHWVIRERDGATVLCPLTPAQNEVLDAVRFGAALRDACDEAFPARSDE